MVEKYLFVHCLIYAVTIYNTYILIVFADKTENACHGSDSPASAAREIEFFFPSSGPSKQNTARFSECTCCVIKPHAVKAGMIYVQNIRG